MSKNTSKTKTVAAGTFSKTEDLKTTDTASIESAAANTAATVVTTATGEVKAVKARAIMDECYKMPTVPARKDIIGRLMSEANLTKAGAATYLQNYKSKNGLVVKKVATPVTA